MSQPQPPAKKIELVRQLLAKAEGNTTPEEAEALTEAAMKIMTRLGIDQAMLDNSKPKDQREEIVCRVIYMNGIYARSLVQMAVHVANGFDNVKLLVTQDVRMPVTGKMADKLWVYGFESDADNMVILLDSLKQQVMVAVRVFFRAIPKYQRDMMTEMEAYKVRREFIEGFGYGVKMKVREDRAEVIRNSAPGTDLVLADRGNLVRSFVDNNIATTQGRGGFRSNSYTGGFNQGAAAGRNATLKSTSQVTSR